MFEELPGPIDNMLQEVKNPCTQAMVTATYQLSFTQLNPTQSKWIQPKLYPIHSCPWPHRDASSISSCWGAMTPSSKACACRMKNNRTKQRGMNPSKKFFWGWYLKRWSKSWGNFWFSTKTHPCSYNPCLTKLPFKGFKVVFRILSLASTKESLSMLGFVVGTGAIDATTCSSSAHISITCLSLFPRFDSVCNLCGGRRSHYISLFLAETLKKGALQPLSKPILFPPACNTSNCMVALEVKRFDNCLLAEGLLKVCFRKLLSDSEVLEICLTGRGILTWTRESCDTAYKSLKEKTHTKSHQLTGSDLSVLRAPR